NTASKSVTVHIKGREEKPDPSVVYLQEKLTGLVSGAAYVIERENITADEQGCISIKEEWFGKDIQISKRGGTNTLDSENVAVYIASRPAAPSVTKIDETIKGKTDGTLAGVSTAMEYSVDGGNIWTSISEGDITDGRITGLKPGVIRICEKATTSAPHGEVKTVTIAEGRALTVAFETNGGSSIASITGKSWEDTVDKPENPVKEGYAFEGWYQESTFETIWNFASDRLTGDVTLYAKWTLKKPSVTLTANGGTMDANPGMINAVYKNGDPVLTLKAELSNRAGNGSGIHYTCEWYKGGEELNITDEMLILQTVDQSGTYKVEVTAHGADGQSSKETSREVIVMIDKATPEVTVKPTASDIKYGDALSQSSLTGGKMTVQDAEVAGVFSWKAESLTPAVTASDTTQYKVVFTPEDTANYRSVTTTLPLKVNKKPITAVWTNLTAEYNETAQAPTCSTLVGLMEVDAGDVFADFTAEQRLANAGIKRLTAVLGGVRAVNYQLTNPDVNFTVQKVPVTFHVTDNSVQADGAAHTATVSASVNGLPLAADDRNGDPVYEITYRDVRGETVEDPADAGSYAIYAELINPNYRHSGTADGTARQIGVLTIYRNQTQTAKTYTVEYATGAEGTSEVTGDLPVEQTGLSEGTLIYLPGKGTLSRTGYAFTGWLLNGKLYQPGETFTMPAKNVTITACWQEATYRISGVVDQEGNPLHHAVVTLKRGSEIIGETTTDREGNYSFEGVMPGLYNLVTAYDGITTTVKVLIKDADAVGNTTLPAGRTNSIVEVTAGAPAVIVGNLEKLFQTAEDSPVYSEIYTENDKEIVETGGTVEIRLTVEKVTQPDQTGAELLKEVMQKLPEAFDYQTELYLDF
ncbi:MAG: InlB B-repeat-containing protein, partial [Hominisplanchenecus sp.]